MTNREYFDLDGHLTNDALTELISGNPDELTRLEIAEHLSFCDACTERYTALLCDGILLAPPEPMAPSVMKRIRQRSRVLFLNRYFSAGLAASLAILFWVTGAFTPTLTQNNMNRAEQLGELSSFSLRISERTAEISRGLMDGINDFFDQFNLKGAQSNEKE